MTLYRLLLHLYPHGFRARYGDELESDFDDGRAAAAREGRAALLAFYRHAAGDLARSVVREWLRTPWPVVLAAAAAASSLLFYYAVGRVYRARTFYSAVQPPESPALALLMAVMVLVPALALVVIVVAARHAAPRHRGRRRA